MYHGNDWAYSSATIPVNQRVWSNELKMYLYDTIYTDCVIEICAGRTKDFRYKGTLFLYTLYDHDYFELPRAWILINK